jgi:DNA processing protein
VYPHSTARLRARVERFGMLVSEAPPGAAPDRWRFPLRNRIIAALASVVVVIESHQAGGALHTVDAADARGVEVMAVPGSVRSPASAGTNALIASGVQIATSVNDVLVALDRHITRVGGHMPIRLKAARSSDDAGGACSREGPPLTEDEQAVLKGLELNPTPTSALLARTDMRLETVSYCLEHLEELGLARDYGGAWGLAPSGGRPG